jgi:CheY-like chemotaxis protein
MPELDAGPQSPLILVVEDERALRKVMELVLQGEGYEVMTANNGREALAMLEQALPDLIISDYVMPEMDGAELVRRVRGNARLAGIPILLMSSAFPEEHGQGRFAGKTARGYRLAHQDGLTRPAVLAAGPGTIPFPIPPLDSLPTQWEHLIRERICLAPSRSAFLRTRVSRW